MHNTNMNLIKQIRIALQNPDFPDLKFLYSSEVLTLAPEVLEALLEEEKKDFEKNSVENISMNYPVVEVETEVFQSQVLKNNLRENGEFSKEQECDSR